MAMSPGLVSEPGLRSFFRTRNRALGARYLRGRKELASLAREFRASPPILGVSGDGHEVLRPYVRGRRIRFVREMSRTRKKGDFYARRM